MYQASMATISAEQNRDRREQAAARRRAEEARGPARARSAGLLPLIVRNARSLTGQKRQGSAAA
jgi:hypothetical protein